MKQEKAIAVAKKYAVNWGIPWGQVTKIKKISFLCFQITSYTFCF